MAYTPTVGALVDVRGVDVLLDVNEDDPELSGRYVVRPAVLTDVGDDTVTARTLTPSGTVYDSLPKWDRSTPTTLGWVRS